MIWLLEGGSLLLVALLLRRLLCMGPHKAATDVLSRRRTPQVEPVYRPLVSEVEAHSTILAVALNDAFEENKAGRLEAAWSMVDIFAGEWNRLTDLIESLQQLALRYLPVVDLPVPVRTLDANCFRSGTMIEFVRFHGFVDQFVFRPKLRFQLHLRLQRRAIAMLSEEFHRTRGARETDSEYLTHALTQLDLYLHDLDRLAKETLLAFRSEMSCLPGHAINEMEAELEEVVNPGVASPLVPANQ